MQSRLKVFSYSHFFAFEKKKKQSLSSAQFLHISQPLLLPSKCCCFPGERVRVKAFCFCHLFLSIPEGSTVKMKQRLRNFSLRNENLGQVIKCRRTRGIAVSTKPHCHHGRAEPPYLKCLDKHQKSTLQCHSCKKEEDHSEF